MAKSHCSQNPVIQLENYRGRVALGPTMFYPGGIKPALITRRGSNPCDFILMASPPTPQRPYPYFCSGVVLGSETS